MKERTYLAVDLKSFFASVECVERGLDPLTTNLVVADAARTEKTICLAVSVVEEDVSVVVSVVTEDVSVVPLMLPSSFRQVSILSGLLFSSTVGMLQPLSFLGDDWEYILCV